MDILESQEHAFSHRQRRMVAMLAWVVATCLAAWFIATTTVWWLVLPLAAMMLRAIWRYGKLVV